MNIYTYICFQDDQLCVKIYHVNAIVLLQHAV